MPKGSNLPKIAEQGWQIANAARMTRADHRAALVAPLVKELQADGLSLRGVARELTARGIPTPRGSTWRASQVVRVLARVPS